ncbi:MAG: hypothetical protein WBE22_08215 [Halobacteriota archaeon]
MNKMNMTVARCGITCKRVLIAKTFERNTIFNAFADSVEKTVIPPAENIYFVKGAPATNNGVENNYSTSLKRHRKKQLMSDMGIENQMKLSAMKRVGLLDRCKKTLLEAFLMFVQFLMFWYCFG